MIYASEIDMGTIVEVPMRTVIVKMFCKNCSSEVVSTGSYNATYPPQFEHFCKNKECGTVGYFKNKYPRIEHREITDE